MSGTQNPRLTCTGCGERIRTSLFSVSGSDVYHPACLDDPTATSAYTARVLPADHRSRVAIEFGNLASGHPVAPAARRICKARHFVPTWLVVGVVACARCWETAIRADERFATEFGLGPADRDPSYIDVVAVERALAGKSVPLTAAERREVEERRSTRPAPIPTAVLAARAA